MKEKINFKHTLYASYLGYITQAIVNNLVPLLFLTFQSSYQISLEQLALLVSINFGVQLVVDLLAVKFVDSIGYRSLIVAAHIFSAIGLISLGILPSLFSSAYTGLICAIILYAIGGGLIEVLISPIVEACPTEEKSSSMSLLHSFYCWGHMAVVILSTVYFRIVGIEHWQMLTFLWAFIPLCNAFYFTKVPINQLTEEKGGSARGLFSMKIFWIFLIMMVCSGAAEQAMSQWASAFAESGLQVSKSVGDLAGPCLFAFLMGISRIFYAKYSEKIKLQKFILGSCILCIISYLLAALSPVPLLALLGCGLCGLSVGILWPGVFSMAAGKCPMGGTAMFALLALGGDLGCSAGPALVGVVSEMAGNNLNLGLIASILFPILLVAGVLYLKRLKTAAAELKL